MTYLWHLTIDSGHGRRSPRHEAGADGVAVARDDLDRAIADGSTPITTLPDYTLRAETVGPGLLCSIDGPTGPLVTFGVARRSLGAATLWQRLGQTQDPPAAPWCAVKIRPGLASDDDAASWLGDYERLIAWAWIVRPS